MIGRMALWCALVSAFCPLPTVRAEDEAKENLGRQVRRCLDQPVNIYDSKKTLKDALDFLAEHYDIPILLDEDAFPVDPKDKLAIPDRPVQLSRMRDISLRKCLRHLLKQVRADFVIRKGKVHVLPEEQALVAQTLQQTIDVEFNKRPLRGALEELMEMTGCSIILDPRTGGKGKTEVTATFKKVTLEAAVKVLADLAGLKPSILDNVLYVTTRENALEIQAEHDLRRALTARSADKPENHREGAKDHER